MGRIEGKVALITGAGSGIGQACMTLFAREGARVVGVSRTQAQLDETLRQVQAEGGEGRVVAADLATEDGAARAFDVTIDAYGRVDVLVTAASLGATYEHVFPGSMSDTPNIPIEAWHRVMQTNVDACFYIYQLVVPQMQAQGGGSIVHVASLSSFLVTAAGHAYSASKATTLNLTRSLAVTYAKDGIRANAIAPGWTDTPMVADWIPILFADAERAEAITPMARPGRPEESAYACLFFASDESSYCNGAVLTVDGGQSARQ
jgi:NAD(P)-dependent dehydrogenase (short-subunit alcohol dehydrogenase family)